jgi:hypothetical protein
VNLRAATNGHPSRRVLSILLRQAIGYRWNCVTGDQRWGKLGDGCTLSPKRAKSRTRGRKRHLSRAKARVGRAQKTRADPEQQLKACRREIARARERLAEALKQQIADGAQRPYEGAGLTVLYD